jgi:hypothetical protein
MTEPQLQSENPRCRLVARLGTVRWVAQAARKAPTYRQKLGSAYRLLKAPVQSPEANAIAVGAKLHHVSLPAGDRSSSTP